ncbi:MAG: oligopeptide transporter, OPT family [Candidatus Marinimicrobia bacterium]|nr:oligopeptide transporter, OPT family [Candidatus Neomarinimicrobiota bacterium]
MTNRNNSLPEITIKAVILGILLSIILAGANAYLGLFAGMTVSASIPAAVISMAILRLFRKSNILENNIVQTAASAGESLAAGVIFTLPALIVMHYWFTFDYWQTTIIAGLGGIIGVLFTIPLRRALIVEEKLKFPEGVATAEVLRVGERGGSGIKYIAQAGLLGAFFKFGETGLRLWTGVLEIGVRVGPSIAYFGSNLSPALVSVGYIVGINIAILVFLGGAINWLVAIPIYAASHPWPVTDGVPIHAVEWASQIWSSKTRFLGVGAMVIGGLWALINLRSSILTGIRASLQTYRKGVVSSFHDVPRVERDTPIKWVGIALVISLLPIFGVYYYVIQSLVPSLLMAVIMLIAGFLFSAVAAYMAGLVGSSNNPISGVTIATILFSSLLLLALLGADNPVGPAAAIFIGAVVACAAAIGGDNLQDLKAGYILGATPWKQQVMQMVGVISAAFVLSPVLVLIEKAYGIGIPTAEHPNPLAAPQATLMASVAQGVFDRNLPWNIIFIGMVIAVIIIIIDKRQEKRQATFRLPVLAVAVGIYLPFELSVPIFLGGLVAWGVKFSAKRKNKLSPDGSLKDDDEGISNNGLLFASGLITGEALVGILMAIPIVISGDANVLAIIQEPLGTWPGVILLAVVIYLLYNVAKRRENNA